MRNILSFLTSGLIALTVSTAGIASTPPAATDLGPLTVETYVADAAGFLSTSTMISSDDEIMLIDAPFTRSEAHRLVAKILKTGKPLTKVVITHAHPDHYFGLEVIRRQYPDVEVYARAAIKSQMDTLGSEKLAAWKPVYGDDLTDTVPAADQVLAGDLTFAGERIQVIDLAPAEIESAVAFFLPRSRTLVAGDAVFDGVHPWLAETDKERRRAWIDNLDRLANLKPNLVIGGHIGQNATRDARAIQATKRYLQAFAAALAQTHNPAALKKMMLTGFGKLDLPVILDYSIQAATGDAPADHSH